MNETDLESRDKSIVEMYTSGVTIVAICKLWELPFPRVWSLLMSHGALTGEEAEWMTLNRMYVQTKTSGKKW